MVELPKEALRDSLVAAQITFKRYANPDTSGTERPGHLQVASAPVVKTEASLPRLRHPEPRTVRHQDLREALASRTEIASVPTTPLGVGQRDIQSRASNLPGNLAAAETAAYLAHSGSFSNRPSPVNGRDLVDDGESKPPRTPSALRSELQLNRARIPPPSHDISERSRSISPQVSYSTSLSSSSSFISDEEDTSYRERSVDEVLPPELSVSSYSLASRVSEKPSETSQQPRESDYTAMNKLNGGNIIYKGTLPDLIPRSQRKIGKPRLKTRLLRSSDSNEYNNNYRQQESLSRIYSNQQQNGKAIINTQKNVKLKTTMRRGKYAITENDETFPYDKRPSDVSSDSDTDDESDSMKIEEKKKKPPFQIKKGFEDHGSCSGKQHVCTALPAPPSPPPSPTA